MTKPKMERLPRGFGCIIKMQGKRRRPYIVKIKIGTTFDPYNEKANTEYKIIGYAASRKDGIIMLQKYHDNPFDMENTFTFKDIYEKAFKEYVADKSRSTILAYEASFRAVPKLHQKIFKEIKAMDLQKAIDNCGKNYPTMRKIKVLFNVMYKYAMKYDLVGKDYSKYVEIAKYANKNPNTVKRDPFTLKDIDKLWTMKENKWYQIILMLIYSGVRISELLELKKENVNLEEHWFDVIKSKTEEGIRRVPIADCTYPFFVEWYEKSTAETLLCMPNGQPFKYRNYFDSYWAPVLENIGMSKYTPHCTRHTCISLLADAQVNQTLIKKIVGHRGAMTLTEKVYTHIDIKILINAVNQIYLPEDIRQDLIAKKSCDKEHSL